ncbi:MAG: hypothetical protein LBQ76_05825 [Candidatus Fibromonas sp.]|jgi:hypothetical protein|nr:hypothetical protein [Candidatus Fibromonas sp.]
MKVKKSLFSLLFASSLILIACSSTVRFKVLDKETKEDNESPRGRDRGVSSSLILAQNRITTVVVAA